MLDLLWDVDVFRVFNFDYGTEANEFIAFNSLTVWANLDQDILGPDISKHGSDVSHALQELACGQHELSQHLFSFEFVL